MFLLEASGPHAGGCCRPVRVTLAWATGEPVPVVPTQTLLRYHLPQPGPAPEVTPDPL